MPLSLSANADNIRHSMDFIYRVLRTEQNVNVCFSRCIIKSLKQANSKRNACQHRHKHTYNSKQCLCKLCNKCIFVAQEDSIRKVMGSFSCDRVYRIVVSWLMEWCKQQQSIELVRIFFQFVHVLLTEENESKHKFSSTILHRQSAHRYELTAKSTKEIDKREIGRTHTHIHYNK